MFTVEGEINREYNTCSLNSIEAAFNKCTSRSNSSSLLAVQLLIDKCPFCECEHDDSISWNNCLTFLRSGEYRLCVL